MTRRLLAALPALAHVLLLAPAGATAAPWTCEASAVRGTLDTAPAIEPVTANHGAAECATQSAGGTLPAGLPLNPTGGALFARTRVDGDASRPEAQRVSAEAGLADLHVPLVPGLPGIPVPNVAPISVPGFGTIDTKVRFRAGNPRLFRTFTLPQYVDVG